MANKFAHANQNNGVVNVTGDDNDVTGVTPTDSSYIYGTVNGNSSIRMRLDDSGYDDVDSNLEFWTGRAIARIRLRRTETSGAAAAAGTSNVDLKVEHRSATGTPIVLATGLAIDDTWTTYEFPFDTADYDRTVDSEVQNIAIGIYDSGGDKVWGCSWMQIEYGLQSAVPIRVIAAKPATPATETIRPASGGDAANWTGTYADIDEVTPSDTDHMYGTHDTVAKYRVQYGAVTGTPNPLGLASLKIRRAHFDQNGVAATDTVSNSAKATLYETYPTTSVDEWDLSTMSGTWETLNFAVDQSILSDWDTADVLFEHAAIKDHAIGISWSEIVIDVSTPFYPSVSSPVATSEASSVDLTADGITFATETTSTTLAAPVALIADAIEFATETTSTTIALSPDLVADAIEFTTEATSTTIVSSPDLVADAIEFATETTSTTIALSPDLVADAIEFATEVSATTIAQSVALAADAIEFATEATSTTIVSSPDLVADAIEFGTEVASTTIAQSVALAADAIEFATEATSTTIVSSLDLVADAIEFGTETTSTTISLSVDLTADAIEFATIVDDAILNQSIVLLADAIEFRTETTSTTIAVSPDLVADAIEFATLVFPATLDQLIIQNVPCVIVQPVDYVTTAMSNVETVAVSEIITAAEGIHC